MTTRDRMLGFTGGLLQVLIVLNLLCVVAFAAVLLATWPLYGAIAAQLVRKYGDGVDVAAVVNGLRGLMLLGVIAAIPAHAIFVRLRRIVAGIRSGDAFASGNAARVRTIGWALLAIQLLDIPLLFLIARFHSIGVEAADYTPSIGGWLSVLVAFILARVFAHGEEMRQELEGTV